MKIVRMMREAGAKEVHFRIASPPITLSRLLRHRHAGARQAAGRHASTSRRCADYIGADSLAFLSVDGLYRAMGETARDPVRPQFTDHCFTGDYPTPPDGPRGRDPRRLAMLAEAD